MEVLGSILKTYKIEEALVKNGINLEIIVLKRSANLTLNDWINMINSIKYVYNKKVQFLMNKDSFDISEFTFLGESYV